MRAFIFVTCLLATTLARPEAAGYNYNGLHSGLPQNVQQLQPQVHQQLPAEHSFANFVAPTSAALASEQLQQLDNTAAALEDATPSHQPSQSQHEDSYNTAYQQSSNAHEAGGYAYAPQQTTIHKHIYVHVPPKEFEDEDVYTPRVHHQAAPKQKHYKIVFIKAPSAPSARPPIVPPPPQNEEKTLIYVLHKKPELEQNIIIPTAAPTTPSKPEVYFIKYKTKKEEAPVYGPPPSQHLDVEPRNIEAPNAEYGAPAAVDSFPPEMHVDATAPLSTIQPAAAEEPQHEPQPQQQFSTAEAPKDVYGVPPTAVIVPEEPQPTLAAPSSQYLAPEVPQTMAPIVVEDTHAPANKYGPPNRFFIKKKK